MRRLLWGALLLLTAGCDTAGFSDAYMSLDSSGKRKREHFFTDTEDIYCVAKVASGVEDVTVSGSLRATRIYDPRGGKPMAVDYYLGVEDLAPGAGSDITVSFKLAREDSDAPYLAGEFVCELAIDGEVRERVPFDVAFPDCPEAPIVNGALCGGFVLEGARCVGALKEDCICKEDGVWSCR